MEVVQAFFDAEKFEEELKKVYAERRKDSKEAGERTRITGRLSPVRPTWYSCWR